MDAIDTYLSIYAKVKAAESELQAMKQEKAQAKFELILYLESNGFRSVGRNDRSVSHSKRSYGKIIDFNQLRDWVSEQDEPMSEFMEEVFIKGSKKDPRGIHGIVVAAQRESVNTGQPVVDCLPPGLEITTDDVITVRTRKSNAKPVAMTALERLQEVIDNEG